MKVCQVIYNYIAPPDCNIGGAETGTYRLCCELLKHGIDVSVSHSAKNPKDQYFEGQELRQWNSHSESLYNLNKWLLNFGHNSGALKPYFARISEWANRQKFIATPYHVARFVNVYNSIKRAKPDIVHAQLNSGFHLASIMYAQKNRIPLCLTQRASDCFGENQASFYTCKNADHNFVTYDHQVKEVKDTYGVNATVAPDPINLPKNKTKGGNILWVGRLVDVKRPMMFVNLAKSLPELNFQMIGYGKLEQKVKRNLPDNLDFVGKLSEKKTYQYYENADLLVSTSSFEGIPCVWLEAWAYSVPVVSTIDRGNMLSDIFDLQKESKGIAVTDKLLKSVVEDLAFNASKRKTLGRNGRNYVSVKHDPKTIALHHKEVYEALLK